MRLKVLFPQWLLTSALVIRCFAAHSDAASVWKITGPKGGTLYLGGSIHALQSTDYPLPPAYNRAFEASTRLAFEMDPKEPGGVRKSFLKSGQYPKEDSLKNHVDPRTYDYLRRLFGLLRIPEEKFSRLRPWYLAALFQAPQLHGLSLDLGVEGFLAKRARANSKPMVGLESVREGVEIFAGLTDRQSEALLLLTFIPAEQGTRGAGRMLDAWRHGDADSLTHMTLDPFHDFPSLGERIVGARNRNWIPTIEGYLRSGRTYFVVVGAGHMGGPDGLLALLRARGYQIEQL